MKLLYVTDLHGVKWKYERIYEIAISSGIDILIDGGDMLPTRPNFFIQDKFILEFFEPYFTQIDAQNMYYLFMPGNDDLIIHDDLLDEIANKYKFIQNIQQRLYKINEFEFIGMNWVTDLPFGLKDRVRMDTNDFKFPRQIGKPIISTKNGLKTIDDWFAYARTLPTIKEELENLVLPENMEKSIYVIHMPPSDVSLDVCRDTRRVGSKAIYEFLKIHQPLLSLHGHIHESPEVSNIWFNKIGKTTCIQPGQSDYYEDYLVYVIIDLDTMNIFRKRVEK